MRSKTALIAGMLLIAGLSAGPANAQLLGNLLDGNDGDTNVGELATIGGGPASDSSLVNLGLGTGGGDNNNIADINLGQGSDRLGNVNVSGGLFNGSGGSDLTAGLDLGGLDLDLTIPGLGDILGGVGGGGGNGGNGGGVRVSSLDGGVGVDCSVNDGRQVLQLASNAAVSNQAIAGWQRAANVRIVPVQLCPQARAQVAQIFRASSKINMLQRAVSGDVLISASLSRSRFDVSDVFAVEQQGGELVVYVF